MLPFPQQRRYSDFNDPWQRDSTLNTGVLLGSLLLVAIVEFCLPWRQRELPALRRRFGNLGIWLLNIVLVGFIFAPTDAFRPRLEAVSGLALPSWPIANRWLSFIAVFLLLDFLVYAVHRCQHAVPFLWRFHALHHSDPEVDVTTAVRHHPVEYVLAGGFYWLVILALDVPPALVSAHALTLFATAALTHGNIRLPGWLERVLQPIIITLDLHRVHHSIAADEANANFGGVLSVWDRLFGTYLQLPRGQLDQIVFGVRGLSSREGPPRSAISPPPRLSSRAVRQAPAGD